MKKLITATDGVAVVLAALMIWAAQDDSDSSVFSALLYIFAGMLLGVFVNKVALRYRTGAKRPAKTAKTKKK